MGKVIVEQIISADDYAADKDGGLDFFDAAGNFSDAEPEQLRMIASVGAIVLGANTYRMLARACLRRAATGGAGQDAIAGSRSACEPDRVRARSRWRRDSRTRAICCVACGECLALPRLRWCGIRAD